MFARRHYKAIAETLKGNRVKPPGYDGSPSQQESQQELYDYYYRIVTQIANTFARDNPRFDRNKFLAACGEVT